MATESEPDVDAPPNLGKLVDVRIRRDRATGNVTSRVPESMVIINRGKRIRFDTEVKHFRRINGRWYVAAEHGDPVNVPLHRIAKSDLPFEKRFDMQEGDVFECELPNGEIVAVWCRDAKNLLAAEQATASGLKTSWGEKPFEHVKYKKVPLPDVPDGGYTYVKADSYIKRGSVVTEGSATSTYQLFVDKWEFFIVEDLKAKESLPVTIRVRQRTPGSGKAMTGD